MIVTRDIEIALNLLHYLKHNPYSTVRDFTDATGEPFRYTEKLIRPLKLHGYITHFWKHGRKTLIINPGKLDLSVHGIYRALRHTIKTDLKAKMNDPNKPSIKLVNSILTHLKNTKLEEIIG